MAQSEKEKQLYDYVYGAALDKAMSTAKPEYAGTYEQQLNDLFDKISNREKFSYDVNADPLYDMYKDKYVQQGKLAMKDTMGQAAALTGGYGNTYGQQVGQQAYDAYLQDLSAVIPELYGQAYKQYQDQGDQLKDLYGMAGQQRDTEYNRYRDELGDWNYQQDLARQAEAQEYERRMYDEQIQRQLEQQEYERRRDEENTAYKKQQDAYSNLIAMIKLTGYRPTDAELQAAGMTREQADAMADEFQYQRDQEELARDLEMVRATSGGSGGGGGGGSYGGSSYGYDDYYYDDYVPTTTSSAASLAAKGASIASNNLGKTKTSYITAQEAGWGDTSRKLTEIKVDNLVNKAASTGNRSDIVAAANAAVNAGSAKNAISTDEYKKIMNSLTKSR